MWQVKAGEELLTSYGPSFWVGGQPTGNQPSPGEEAATGGETLLDSEAAAAPADRRGGDGTEVLDAAYWRGRGGPRTAALLAESSLAVASAERGVRASRVAMEVEAAFEAAMEYARDLEEAQEAEAAKED